MRTKWLRGGWVWHSGRTARSRPAANRRTFYYAELLEQRMLLSASAAATTTPTQLIFVQQPTSATAGYGFAPVTTVEVADASGNPVTSDDSIVTLLVASGPTQNLYGTTAAPAVDGIATFSIVTTDAGTYTLEATDGSLKAATSNSFTISPGTAARLAFDGQPTITSLGDTISPSVTVDVDDSNLNLVPTDNSDVKLSIASGPAGAVLGGTLTQQAINGVATFGDLNLDLAGAYTLQATDGSLGIATSNPFTIAVPRLAFNQQPTNTIPGSTINPAVTVDVENTVGSVLASYNSNVTISLASGPAGATLGGWLTVKAVNGVATFSNLTLSEAGTYALLAAHNGVTSATSSSFTVTDADTPTQLAFDQQPTSTMFGNTIAPAITVGAENAVGSLLSSFNANVTISIASGPAGTVLGGWLTVKAVNGMATFSNLCLAEPGAYTLLATHKGLTSATSDGFTINAGAPVQLVFQQQPTNATYGSIINPGSGVTVIAEDSVGHLATSYDANVTIAIASGPTGATPGGWLTVKANSGVAVFSNLTLAEPGTYTLVASHKNLASATSNSFTISGGGAASPEMAIFGNTPIMPAATDDADLVALLELDS